MNITKTTRSSKSIASLLNVYVWRANKASEAFCLAGQLTLQDLGTGDANELLASFKYSDEYLNSSESYPLDPINLPLRQGAVSTRHAFVALGAIFDAAPDAWGRRVVQASESQLLEDGSIYSRAFLRGADGIGAMLLKPAYGDDSIDELTRLVQWSRDERPTLGELNNAALATRRLEQSEGISEEHKRLLAGSWTIGGARPKAIVRNEGTLPLSEALTGRSLIAKFPTINESVDRSKIEWACLRMARDMGFEVPGHALADVATGTALLLERFDRYALSTAISPLMEGRRHYISANSLVSSLSDTKRLDTAHDKVTFSFGNLMSIAARVAAKPNQARSDMYARLVLNTALHNTDDHLKNFGFLKDDNSRALHLSPVFDLSPQGLGSHFVHLGDFGRRYNIRDVRGLSRSLGVAAGAAATIEEKILTVLERRSEYFEMADLALNQRQAVEALIASGTGGLLSPVGPAPLEELTPSTDAPGSQA